ncbi:hypothetical protein [Nocardiopsis baichengensis]|uniref:hypothetical protein n=1 Tax=Nocardiopsis baichengensis TaxID=280240 RepID=UPI0003486891|nr:hypothetical protein [Nocardiopsis baichengensis]
MDEGLVLVLVVGGAIALIAAIAASAAAHEKKVKALKEWAGRNGWRYQEERPELVEYFEGTPFTGRGKAEHVLTGAHRGHRMTQFEYSYTTTSNNGQTTVTHTHRYRITALETPHPTPVLEVKDSHFGHALLDLLGMHDFRLDDPEFDTAFRVATSDDGFARAVLPREVRDWLTVLPIGHRYPLRFTGDHVICWEKAPMGHEPDLRPADFLADLFERVPDEVWERKG